MNAADRAHVFERGVIARQQQMVAVVDHHVERGIVKGAAAAARLIGRFMHDDAVAAFGGDARGLTLMGSPTVIADTRNAADIANFAPGPGFPWTLTVTPGQQAGIAWLKAEDKEKIFQKNAEQVFTRFRKDNTQ